MYVFRTPKEKTWHILTTLVECSPDHAHTAPSVCRKVNIRTTDRMDSIRAHDALFMCRQCIEGLVLGMMDPVVHCKNMVN